MGNLSGSQLEEVEESKSCVNGRGLFFLNVLPPRSVDTENAYNIRANLHLDICRVLYSYLDM